MDKLEQARAEIDRIDGEMAKLFESRMRAVEAVSEYKQAHGLPVLDADREAEVIKQAANRIDDEEIRSYYITFLKNNMKLSRNFQQKRLQGMSIAYCGIEGSFASIAAEHIFPQAHLVPCPSFAQAWQAAVNGTCDCAVLPLENSSNGEVGQVMDLMMFDRALYVNHVYALPVVQNLLGIKGSHTTDITRVVSHEQALGQCATFLEEHGITPVASANTAIAAQQVAQMGDVHTGAIASEQTAKLYGLEILERHINSSESNITRFAVFSRVPTDSKDKENGDKEKNSILLFRVIDQVGALAKAMNMIALYGYNMRVLRSRPTKDWGFQYYFYIELEGDINSESGRQMCRQLSSCCEGIRIGGTYRRSDADAT